MPCKQSQTVVSLQISYVSLLLAAERCAGESANPRAQVPMIGGELCCSIDSIQVMLVDEARGSSSVFALMFGF